jgi:hypothetical protein
MELKLETCQTLKLTETLMGFYRNLHTIKDYFLERKKEKVVNLDHDKYTKLMFNDYSIEPKDMQFEIEIIEGKLFNPATQIITSLPLESQIGRQIMIGVKETNSNKYVGFIRLASPVLSIKPRNDLFEGFKITANEVNKYMINGAIIVPVQPFGYNYLGGKLLALICCSHDARQMLKDKYGDRIDTVFMETTSLYGDLKGVSQYDGLKPFMKYGSMTESDLFLFPNDEVFMEIRNVLRPLYGKPEWGGSMVDPGPSGPKMREFNKMISILKNHLKVQNPVKFKEFSDFTKSHMKAKTKKRYYYCNYGYDNVAEYISSDGKVPLVKRDNWDRYHVEHMIEWWKNKAQSRYEKLKEEGRLRNDLEIYTLERIESGNVDMVR